MGAYSERILKGGRLIVWQRTSRFVRAVEAILRHSDNQPVCAMLDIGAADGIGLPFLKRAAKTVVSVNYYDGHTRQFQASYPDETVITADARNLPLPDASFDAVVSFETLHLIKDRDKCVAEAARLLGPKGLLVCSVPIEVGYTAIIKYIARGLFGFALNKMGFLMAVKHVFYRVSNVEKYDEGRQVGFNVYSFIRQIEAKFDILETQTIPLPVLFPMNKLIVARKK